MTQQPNDDVPRATESERRRVALSALQEWWERLSERSSAWDLETVKHLVVLNAAGFAGVATLLAGNKLLQPRLIGAVALLGYGIGVVFAILNMYLASVSFTMMLDEVKERMMATADLSKSIDHASINSPLDIALILQGRHADGWQPSSQ